MRKITSDFIFSPQGELLPEHTLILEDNGSVIDLVKGKDNEAEIFKGILTPGFINAHCHLELSYMANLIPKGKGLQSFLHDFVTVRKNNTADIIEAIIKADQQMWNNGIQGVGDICNTTSTFTHKQKSPVRYHSFIELFNFRPGESEFCFSDGIVKYNLAIAKNIPASIVPHAPYSVPRELFELIAEHQSKVNGPWCIHNQESESENEMFRIGKGKLFNTFVEMGVDLTWFNPTGKNSLPSLKNVIPAVSNLLFVHNTYTSQVDIDFLATEQLLDRAWFCLCTNANLYIEKRLPDIHLLISEGCKITLGTDSLSSNTSLSILDEMKTIQSYFPDIKTSKLLSWATINGAAYFGWDDLGAFRKGTRPGVLLISKADDQVLSPDSSIERIY